MHESRYIVKQILCFSKICFRSIKLHYPKTADCTASEQDPCHRVLAWRRLPEVVTLVDQITEDIARLQTRREPYPAPICWETTAFCKRVDRRTSGDSRVKAGVSLAPTCSLVRMDQTCFARSGGFAAISLPLFQGVRWITAGAGFSQCCMAILPQLLRVTSVLLDLPRGVEITSASGAVRPRDELRR
jgi:hypothetical protein